MAPAGPLQGKLAIVTGASRGIGAAIAENLASKGSNVVLNYVSDSSHDLAAKLATRLYRDYGVLCKAVQADVGTPEGAQKVINAARSFSEAWRPEFFQINIIVNNAGVAKNAFLPDVTIEDFSETYRVNVLGPLLLTQAAQPYLPQDRSGRIVNISSVSSSTGFVSQTVYGGTKAALEAMTRTWARELAENATVNAINPGPVEGPMYASNSPEFLAGIKGWIMHTPLMATRPSVDSPDSSMSIAGAEEDGSRPAQTSEVAGIPFEGVKFFGIPLPLIRNTRVQHISHPILHPILKISISAPKMADDPFGDILNLEDQFYEEGYRQGQEDGVKAGRSEGRQLGLEQGFQKFAESGRLYGRAIVWANRLPRLAQQQQQQQHSREKEQEQEQGSAGDQKKKVEEEEKIKQLRLPLLPNNARLEKNVITMYALVETDTLSTENSDEAVNDFDDRIKRAQGKAKIIERAVGEVGAAGGAKGKVQASSSSTSRPASRGVEM
ncbi:hypothetical protein B0T19DRAFT_484300 [Cercophora scortea]|uniref:Ketoreductase domain-containing protein n=1 Tax=Cercophora scortea TaxID=314031 RepID=A0AAE0ILA3_9PEZI|nr:hypothetical protein B0T19DRAFT_484300 [Cercophora scortea]